MAGLHWFASVQHEPHLLLSGPEAEDLQVGLKSLSLLQWPCRQAALLLLVVSQGSVCNLVVLPRAR